MQKGRFHRRLMYHLYLSRMSCPWLPKWMNCAMLSSMLIWILFVLRSREVNKHLRPISLTPILSKMSEAYVVDTCVKPAVLERIDPKQFGAVPKSSTTHALISMLHSWLESTDGNGATTRAVLFDFSKSFDLFHHYVPTQKLPSYDFPIMSWILDFPTNRRQRVKLAVFMLETLKLSKTLKSSRDTRR